MLFGVQACSRSSPSHDSYFGGAVGGKEYSTGVFRKIIGPALSFKAQMLTTGISYCREKKCIFFLVVTHSTYLPGIHVALRKAPKWLKRPVGATFGFGGTLVSFAPKKTTPGATAVGSEVRGE